MNKHWRPQKNYKDIIMEYGKDLTVLNLNDQRVVVSLNIYYDDIPEQERRQTLTVLADKFTELGFRIRVTGF